MKSEEVFIQRELTCLSNNKKTKILVSIGKPVRDEVTGGDFKCPFQIEGIGDEALRFGYGVDGLQALLLSLKMIEALLLNYAKRSSANISWLQDNYPGFHV